MSSLIPDGLQPEPSGLAFADPQDGSNLSNRQPILE